MTSLRFAFTIVALLLIAGFAGAASAGTIVCESSGRQTQFCRADTSAGVRLSTQYSGAGCYQGSTWGYDKRGIWVSNGCRAEFELGNYRRGRSSNSDSKAAAALAIGIIGAAVIIANKDRKRDSHHDYDRDDYNNRHRGGPDELLTCESRDGRETDCPARIGRGSVDIDRQLSSTPCRYGQNWGYDGRSIWVADGCRAQFAVYR